jgi:2-polyprenyl-3-methyl-5-hydroxy-6-metoxy-1,4-benzoquinol methylase
MTARDLRDLLNRYADRSWLSRRYLRLRAAYYPLEAYLSHLPPQGTVIDVGCGYGLLAILLAQARPQLEVRGLDPVEERIRTAAKAARGLDRVKFIIGGWEQLAEQRADAVMLIDMLHHVRKDQHEPLLRAAAAALNPGGVLLVNETDPSTPERWRYWWN